MSPGDRELIEGVRSLRVALGEAQQQFSNRLGVSIATVVRYESQTPPRGPILGRLAKIAAESQQPALSTLFISALDRNLEGKEPVARALINLRTKLGETRRAFAARAGLSVISVSRYETNKMPSVPILERLAEIAKEHGCEDESRVFRSQYTPYLRMSPEQLHRLEVQAKFSNALRTIEPERLAALEKILEPSEKLFSIAKPNEPGIAIAPELRAAAWLLSDEPERSNLREYLIGAIGRVVNQRRSDLTGQELETLGDLGVEAIRIVQTSRERETTIASMSMGQALRGIRTQLDLTEAELAETIGVTLSDVVRFESGAAEPDGRMLQRIASLFAFTASAQSSPEFQFILRRAAAAGFGDPTLEYIKDLQDLRTTLEKKVAELQAQPEKTPSGTSSRKGDKLGQKKRLT